MSQRHVPASNVYRFKASVGQMNWKVEVCFLEPDVNKSRGVDGHIGICIRCDERAGKGLEGCIVEFVEEDPYAEWHVLELDPCEMIWKVRRIGMVKINLHNGACTFVDESINGTELARKADTHTFVEWEYAVQMARVVDIRGSKELVHKIVLLL